MDGSRFDTFTKTLATVADRRRLLKLLAGLGLGGTVAVQGSRPAMALPKFDPCHLGPGTYCTCEPCDSTCCEEADICDHPICTGEDRKFQYGISGAGSMRMESGVAHFSLFASSVTNVRDDPGAGKPLARLQWADPDAGVTLESIPTQANWYGWLQGVEGGREVLGWATVNGEGYYPYILRAVAAGSMGTAAKSIHLLAGDAVLDHSAAAELEPSGFRYEAQGALVGGDLQLLTLEWVDADDQGTPVA